MGKRAAAKEQAISKKRLLKTLLEFIPEDDIQISTNVEPASLVKFRVRVSLSLAAEYTFEI
ncbi:hypothetical protein LB535_20875 [Mesorhizobium sp. CA10]|uniref:hypothetical protein n=1 Tax=Mesorhizobium sp. CA10 TaxID=588495 RepID=UPI001CCB8374|nr:hypothetical protein [Mesorhizobium sp. CA10]MBZ9884805.1 hypothetical protein [Mesorhizobium sp. CA10]